MRSQGSYLGWPAEALKARMLKPVMLGLGPPWAARSILLARTRRQRWSMGSREEHHAPRGKHLAG